MIEIIVLLGMLLGHWVSDFVMQTDWEAENKSSNNKALLQHTLKYSLIITFCMVFYLNLSLIDLMLFFIITLITHTIVDFFTSRLNTHNFFVSVGFDQFLHIIQLVFTYKLLT